MPPDRTSCRPPERPDGRTSPPTIGGAVGRGDDRPRDPVDPSEHRAHTSDADSFVRDAPGPATVTIPAGHLLTFEVIGGGGGGGHWGGSDGAPGIRITGSVPARPDSWVIHVHCGQGGQVDDDTTGGGPSLGGSGGRGHEDGGNGGWGSNWSSGGGGGGGGASAIRAADSSVHVIAPGGGGGGGGGQQPTEGIDVDAMCGVDGDGGAEGPTSRAASEVIGEGRGGDGDHGVSRRRVAGGGGGGGGGGRRGGGGGRGGAGGGAGGSGGSGSFFEAGVVFPITGLADHNRTRLDGEPIAGQGGSGGAADERRTGVKGSSSRDPRLGSPGRDGRVRLTWSAPGQLARRSAEIHRSSTSRSNPSSPV